MRYELFISEEAREQLREHPEDIHRNIGNRLRVAMHRVLSRLHRTYVEISL